MSIQLNVRIRCDLFDKVDAETDPFYKIAVIDIQMDMFKFFCLTRSWTVWA